MGGVAWKEEEDHLLKKCIERYGEGKWHRVPLLAGLNRCRKSCRLRWLNYLRPNINRGSFAEEEVQLIIKLHKLLGNRWSLIAGRLPGRTANDVKNYWNCHLSKKLNIAQLETSDDQEDQDQNATINVEIIRPQARTINGTTSGLMKPTSPDRHHHYHHHVAPNSYPTVDQESSSMSTTTLNFVEVDHHHEQGQQEVVKEEENSLGVDHDQQQINAGVFVGDFGSGHDHHQFGQFDEVNHVLSSSTDEDCSKWDWDDLILDMDLWNDL